VLGIKAPASWGHGVAYCPSLSSLLSVVPCSIAPQA
jgi:hypothetical protein